MELGRGYNYKAMKLGKMKNSKRLRDGVIALNPETVIVIGIPNVQILRILSRSLFLAMVLVSLPFLGTILKGFSFSTSSNSFVSEFDIALDSINAENLESILQDLADEGILKRDDTALVVNPPNGFSVINPFNNNDIDVVTDSDWEGKRLFIDETYNFVFTSTSIDVEFVDRILKIDGIVALPLRAKPLNSAFREQTNYRVVFLRRCYGSIVVAMKKISPTIMDSSPKRKLFQLPAEVKTMALKGLEDVLLEPPRRAFAKPKKYLKKIKFLPELLGDDSLEGYNRRLFIGVGLPEENNGVIQWFEENYPKKNTKFEIHSFIVAPEEDMAVTSTDVSAWLWKHVKEEDYVVMKAEAEVVEEMMKDGTIGLVDELFLECKNEWWKRGEEKEEWKSILGVFGFVWKGKG